MFAPTIWPTLAAACFFALTFWLGQWQSGRAEEKRALQARADAATDAPLFHIGQEKLDMASVLDRRVEVVGHFDDAHSILLDNRVYRGVAGYHVLTPLRIEGGEAAVLVNRGWVAAGRSREVLPATSAPSGTISVEGRAASPTSRYIELGDASPRGQVWQNLDFDRYAAQARLKLHPVLITQTSDSQDGLVRDWPRPDAGVSTHVGYAFQWYSLATTLVVLWLLLNFRRVPTTDHAGEMTKK